MKTKAGDRKLKQRRLRRRRDDGNENGKKTIALDWQNSNFVRITHFCTFFAVVARLQRETSYLTFCGRRERKTIILLNQVVKE